MSKEISNLKEFLIQQGKEIVKIKQENKVKEFTKIVMTSAKKHKDMRIVKITKQKNLVRITKMIAKNFAIYLKVGRLTDNAFHLTK